ncbi:MAG TPA: TrkA family potassium uptake protein [Cyclobacteriaceae bacterium]|nr:TrkA family potassium uptake protein [Cyclobacteriaceae bacterium]
MKYIIVGLGNFGASLSQILTAHGNEVIGIDQKMERVEHYKENISHTICMDATDETAVAGLPLEDTDIVIIAIGEDQGANILATAVFKNMKVKRLISRAINSLHEKILMAIGVDEIVRPEEETAERWGKKLSLKNVIDSFELNDDFSIIEANVPQEFVGKTIKEVDFRRKYSLLVLTIMNKSEVDSAIGKHITEKKIQDVPTPNMVLNEDDIIVLYGSNINLKKFLKDSNTDD